MAGRRKKPKGKKKTPQRRPRDPILLLTNSEMDALKALWVLGAATCGDIRDVVGGGDRAFSRYTEIQSSLYRLEKRGIVSVIRMKSTDSMMGIKQTNIYQALFTREELLNRQIEVVNKWFENQFEIGGLL